MLCIVKCETEFCCDVATSFPQGVAPRRGYIAKEEIFMYKFTAKEKMYALKALRSADTLTVCRRYRVNRTTLWRWRRRYDGTIESLAPKFSRKGMRHPNEQTDEEKKNIHNLLRRNPNIGLNELYEKLYRKYEYRRNPVTLYRYLRRCAGV